MRWSSCGVAWSRVAARQSELLGTRLHSAISGSLGSLQSMLEPHGYGLLPAQAPYVASAINVKYLYSSLPAAVQTTQTNLLSFNHLI